MSKTNKTNKTEDKVVKNKATPKPDKDTFKFRSKDGTAQAIPSIGKINIIELIQENRTDWLATRLSKDEALRYSTGEVETRHGDGIGEVCVIATKYRGDAIDANRPERAGEVYSLVFTPFFAEENADLEHVSEGVTDSEIKHTMLALDESKALKFRNKYLIEKEMRIQMEEYYRTRASDFTYSTTGIAAKAVNDVDLGERAVDKNTGSPINFGKILEWINRNKLTILIVAGIALFIVSMFMER
jgi:hypothetical protein